MTLALLCVRPRQRAILHMLLACLCSGWIYCVAVAADVPLDSLSQAVVDSLAHPPRTAPTELLDAAIKASDVEASGVAKDYFKKLADVLEAAGDKRLDLLADLGDFADSGSLLRLQRTLGPSDPSVGPIVAAISEASRLRRRDPNRLSRAAQDLRAGSYAVRLAAIDQLARARVDALPVLVDLLQTDDPAGQQARSLARGLVYDLRNDAIQPLLTWLDSDDLPHWPGVIAAIDACQNDAAYALLLAPACVPGTPPAAQERAIAALVLHAQRCRQAAGDWGDGSVPQGGHERDVPDASAAIAIISQRLDHVLTPAGLPSTDHLLPQTNERVERFFWNAAANQLVSVKLTPRTARSLEASHLARDLLALGVSDPDGVRLVLLSQLEEMLVTFENQVGGPAEIPAENPVQDLEKANDPAKDLARGPTQDLGTLIKQIDPKQLEAALTGPDGLDPIVVAEVLSMALEREMPEAAAAAIHVLENAYAHERNGSTTTLPPTTRKLLVHLLDASDDTLAYAAARSLVLSAGDPPYAGSSRVLAVLLRMATAHGTDRAIIAHPDVAVAQRLAADVSRHGYQTVRVSTGRAAVLAARESCDTVLMLLAARLTLPTVMETVQFIQQPGAGKSPPVMIVVDPLDDDARGKKLTRLILQAGDCPGVAIVDGLESFFQAPIDPDAGQKQSSARFPEVLATISDPSAADPAVRQQRAAARLARARESLNLLALLAGRGWDVRAAVPTARLALSHELLFPPALSLLSAVGSAEAQQAILRQAAASDLPRSARNAAGAAFGDSVDAFGILLESPDLLAAYRKYNRAPDGNSREVSGAILNTLEATLHTLTPTPADAAQSQSSR